MKPYKKPESKVIKIESTNILCCSCVHDCVGTQCNCGCKGWVDDDINELEE